MIKNKKAQILWMGYTFLAVLAFIGLIILYHYLSAEVECSGLNPSCPSDQYCGADFKCYSFPDLAKSTTQTEVVQMDTIFPALLIILVSIIISYFILRRSSDG